MYNFDIDLDAAWQNVNLDPEIKKLIKPYIFKSVYLYNTTTIKPKEKEEKIYCCNLFKLWMTSGTDEYIGYNYEMKKYTVTVEYWTDDHPINFCPFCGNKLR